MATGTLVNGATALNDTITLAKQSDTVLTLNTAAKYVEKNVQLTINAPAATPDFDGGALNNKSATATFTNATTSATDTSGVVIQAKGAAGRDAVLFNGALNGWVVKSDNAVASSAIASSEWNGTTYYLTGVELSAPATGTRAFSITVPNGNESPVSFTFTVDANGNTTIT